MQRLTHHLRGLSVAIVALTLTAGAALAAGAVDAPPDAAADGLSRAATQSGKTVPVRPDAVPTPAAEVEAPAAEDETAPFADDNAAARKQNHGWAVSEAAKGDVPAGSANRGAHVSSIAKGDAGKPEGATPAAERGNAPDGAGSTGASASAAGKAKAAEGKAKADAAKDKAPDHPGD